MDVSLNKFHVYSQVSLHRMALLGKLRYCDDGTKERGNKWLICGQNTSLPMKSGTEIVLSPLQSLIWSCFQNLALQTQKIDNLLLNTSALPTEVIA